MIGNFNVRLIAALSPGLILGVIAIVFADRVEPSGARLVLEILAIGAIASMSWRVGAAALGGTLSRTHGVPSRLEIIAGDRRRPTFDRETGLHAEWYFRLRADEEIARAKRYDQPFTVLLISAKSKSTLKKPRIEMKKWLREIDFAGDLGTVLAICLPNTTRSGAWIVVERLTAVVQGIDVQVTAFPTDGQTLSALLHEDQWNTTPAEESAA